MIQTIVSGGNTGADQGGLFAAEILGIATGGYAPKYYRTEEGTRPELLGDRFGLIESEHEDYTYRTRENVLLADATVIFGRRSPGSNRTEEECRIAGKPCAWVLAMAGVIPKPNIPALQVVNTYMISAYRPRILRFWLIRNKVSTLNVAGNRESKNPGIGEFTKHFLIKALQ